MPTPVSAILATKTVLLQTASPNALVFDAVSMMSRAGVGCLLIVEAGTLIGIFTERDLLVRVAAAGRDPAEVRLRDVMTPKPVTVTVATSIEAALTLVTERGIRHLPVIDGDRLAGIVSIRDLATWRLQAQQEQIETLVRATRPAAPGRTRVV